MTSARDDRGLAPLPQLPWWTVADDAELGVLVGEMVDGYYEHREHPSVNDALGESLDVILTWRNARERYSRAQYLRALLDETNGNDRRSPR